MLGGGAHRLGNTVLFIYLLFTSSACVSILCKSEVIMKFFVVEDGLGLIGLINVLQFIIHSARIGTCVF